MNEDICQNRHGGDANSVIAFERTIRPNRSRLQLVVLFSIAGAATATATMKDVMADTGLSHPTTGARISELKAAGLLEKTGERRNGCAIYRLSPDGWATVAERRAQGGGQ